MRSLCLERLAFSLCCSIVTLRLEPLWGALLAFAFRWVSWCSSAGLCGAFRWSLWCSSAGLCGALPLAFVVPSAGPCGALCWHCLLIVHCELCRPALFQLCCCNSLLEHGAFASTLFHRPQIACSRELSLSLVRCLLPTACSRGAHCMHHCTHHCTYCMPHCRPLHVLHAPVPSTACTVPSLFMLGVSLLILPFHSTCLWLLLLHMSLTAYLLDSQRWQQATVMALGLCLTVRACSIRLLQHPHTLSHVGKDAKAFGKRYASAVGCPNNSASCLRNLDLNQVLVPYIDW